MSIEHIVPVLHHFQGRGSTKLVLLGLANHANASGEAWPAVGTLARYAGITRRNAQKTLTTLEAMGVLERLPDPGPTVAIPLHRRPNLYRITVGCPPNCDHSPQHRLCRVCGPEEYRHHTFMCAGCTVREELEARNQPAEGRGVASDAPPVTEVNGVSPATPPPLSPATPLPLSPATPEPSLEPSQETSLPRGSVLDLRTEGATSSVEPVDNSEDADVDDIGPGRSLVRSMLASRRSRTVTRPQGDTEAPASPPAAVVAGSHLTPQRGHQSGAYDDGVSAWPADAPGYREDGVA